MVGAGRFELPTPGPPDLTPYSNNMLNVSKLAGLSPSTSGHISGLLDVFKRLSHLFIEDVSVASCRLNVGVIEGALHKFQIAGISKQLGTHVVTDVVEPKVLNARFLVLLSIARGEAPPNGTCAVASSRIRLRARQLLLRDFEQGTSC
jgi:hypothetical protein